MLEAGAVKSDVRLADHDRQLAAVTQHVDRLQQELDGVSRTQAVVPPSASRSVIFGNQSGHRAELTITNLTPGASGLSVKVSRIARPSDQVDVRGNPVTSALPRDFETTEWLDISSQGSRRQVVVPCGVEVSARNGSVSATIALLIKYDKDACQI